MVKSIMERTKDLQKLPFMEFHKQTWWKLSLLFIVNILLRIITNFNLSKIFNNIIVVRELKLIDYITVILILFTITLFLIYKYTKKITYLYSVLLMIYMMILLVLISGMWPNSSIISYGFSNELYKYIFPIIPPLDVSYFLQNSLLSLSYTISIGFGFIQTVVLISLAVSIVRRTISENKNGDSYAQK